MEKLVDIYDIAQSIQDDLNALSESLYPESIDTQLEFRVYDDFDEYNNAKIETNKIPCILQSLGGNIDPSQGIELYNTPYILRSYAYEDTTDSYKTILNQYATNISGQIDTFDSWGALKEVTQTPFYVNKVVDYGKERIIGQIQINYTFVIGLLSNETSISLDGILIPTSDFSDRIEKTNNSTDRVGDLKITTNFNNSTYVLEANLVYLKSNTKIVELVNEIYDDTKLNNIYELVYNDPVIGDQLKNVKLSTIRKTHVSTDFVKLYVVFLETKVD